MKTMKKPLLVFVAALLLLATLLAGCSGSSQNGTESSPPASPTATPGGDSGNGDAAQSDVWEFGSSPLEFSAYAHYGWLDFPANMEDVPFWAYLKEHKNVNIKTIQANGNHAQLMATMIADNNLPDLIYGDRFHPDIERLYEAGKLVPLDDYIEKYPNLKKWLTDDIKNLLRADDGKLYKIPNWYTDAPNGNAGYVVNKKIYNELGAPPLETMDDLYNYLVKVKQTYGEEIIPFEPDRAVDGQGVGLLYTGFKENAYYRSLSGDTLAAVDEENNKLTSIFSDPALRESQKFVSKLYREKLISQDMFTITDRGPVQEKVMTGRVAVYAGANPLTYASQAHTELTRNDPDAGYFVIWPIRKAGLDKNKIFPGGYDRLGWNVSVITTAAKDPEKIFAFLDWNTGPEGMTIQFFGPEGKNWQGFDENEQPIFTDNYDPVEVAELQGKNDPVMIAGNTSYIDPAKMKYELSKPEEERNWNARYQHAVTWKTHIDQTALASRLNPSPDSELGDIRQSVLDIFLQAFSESATAKSDEEVDKILDKAEADAFAVGYEKLLEWRTERWLENKAKLGIK